MRSEENRITNRLRLDGFKTALEYDQSTAHVGEHRGLVGSLELDEFCNFMMDPLELAQPRPSILKSLKIVHTKINSLVATIKKMRSYR